MGEYLSIKVSIANRHYPLRITQEEQERVMKAAESVNKRIKEFEENYAVKDKQDLLAMCALQFASEAMGQHKKEKDGKDELEIKENIDYLTLLIDEYLEKETASSQ
ncbi:MAG: cell division protein ZapA [Bacteroidetes bacterium]|nr:MAG: cell division protein ZapA [Bacteroidota bacterium]REJ99666.1 MAG: cell division protein ZapA [Bacteroidota bacterium]REK33899.1 MAG: cell division protein ZapA [Bacteroidota bacterium]REK47664.1 MAG: cell division protein ZapA [Bacteroidota bacterium]